MWSLRRPALATLLVVELVAVIATVATVGRVPVRAGDWLVLGILAVGSVVHLEAVRGIERFREGVRANTPYIDLKSVWTFAGVLLLPPDLAIALVVFTFAHMRLRVQRRQWFRWVYTVATVVLATEAAAAVLYAGLPGGGYPHLPTSWQGVGVIILAALVRWFINHGLVVAIILVSSPNTPASEALGSFSNNVVEVAGVSLGAVTALVAIRDPWYIALILPPLLVLHRSLLLRQYEVAARTDSKTGLCNAVYWSEMARGELTRAERDNTMVGVIMLDLDHFKKINDTYGHLTGDAVLKNVATALKREAREYDVVGRFGGEEFMILLPNIDAGDLPTVAERFRAAIGALTVISPDTGATVRATASAGVASFPHSGHDLDELLLAADAALYTAKESGRNRMCLAPAVAGAVAPEVPETRPAED